MFEDDTDDDIRSLNALAMTPEAHQLVGDCPDCGTPKYHWEHVGPNWHCPKCGNDFPIDEEYDDVDNPPKEWHDSTYDNDMVDDDSIPWPKEVDEEEADWPAGRPEDDDLPGPSGGMGDDGIPEKTTPDQANPDEALGEEGAPLKESQLWSPNHKPVSEGFFDKRMDEPITGPAATEFIKPKKDIEEPEGEDPEVTDYWRAHESTMGADGEWGIDGNIARALGQQKMNEAIEGQSPSQRADFLGFLRGGDPYNKPAPEGDLGDVGEFEKPAEQVYTMTYTIYPSRGEFRPKQKTFKFRARNNLGALTRVLYKLYFDYEGESYKEFLKGEDLTDACDGEVNEENVKAAIDYNSEETCLDSLKDEAGNLIHSSREEGEDDEEEEDYSMDEAINRPLICYSCEKKFKPGTLTKDDEGHLNCPNCGGEVGPDIPAFDESAPAMQMASSLEGLIDVFFSDLKGVYKTAIESGDVGAFKTLIQTMDQEVLSHAPDAYAGIVRETINRIKESFMSELDLENQEEDENYTLNDAKEILINALEDMDTEEALAFAGKGLSHSDQILLKGFMNFTLNHDNDSAEEAPQETCKCGWTGPRGDLIWKQPFGKNRGIGDAYCPQCNAYVTGYDSTD